MKKLDYSNRKYNQIFKLIVDFMKDPQIKDKDKRISALTLAGCMIYSVYPDKEEGVRAIDKLKQKYIEIMTLGDFIEEN